MVVGTWNLENLFRPAVDGGPADDEAYEAKLDSLAGVITGLAPAAPTTRRYQLRAQLSLSRVFADAYAERGVLVNAVTPGPVDTPLWSAQGGLADQLAEQRGAPRDDVLQATRGKIPLGRFGSEDEVAAVIVFLCSSRSSNVTGAAWSVDGGSVPIIL